MWRYTAFLADGEVRAGSWTLCGELLADGSLRIPGADSCWGSRGHSSSTESNSSAKMMILNWLL